MAPATVCQSEIRAGTSGEKSDAEANQSPCRSPAAPPERPEDAAGSVTASGDETDSAPPSAAMAAAT